ncbi:hypothetical protein [Streptomyces sp. NBC_00063]|uniref:hypothetical protein n=1 Tax=Streptomyces sp. NBC_00063 TaxID=2975638 RepID=UPI003D734BBC
MPRPSDSETARAHSSLTQADLVILRAERPDVAPVVDPFRTVMLQMDRAREGTVMVAGRQHQRDGRLLGDNGALLEEAYTVAVRLTVGSPAGAG